MTREERQNLIKDKDKKRIEFGKFQKVSQEIFYSIDYPGFPIKKP